MDTRNALIVGGVPMVGSHWPERNVTLARATTSGGIEFIQVAPLNHARANAAAGANERWIYVVGGRGSAPGNVLRSIEFRPTYAAADQTPWEETVTLLPMPLEGAAVVVEEDEVFLVGGRNDKGEPNPFILSAKVLENGQLGEWRIDGTLTEPRTDANVLKDGPNGFIVGGVAGDGRAVRIVERFNTNYRELGDRMTVEVSSIAEFRQAAGFLQMDGQHFLYVAGAWPVKNPQHWYLSRYEFEVEDLFVESRPLEGLNTVEVGAICGERIGIGRSGSWLRVTERVFGVAFFLNGNVYVAGGASSIQEGCGALNIVERIDLKDLDWSDACAEQRPY